jgi:hypothetical protein
VWRGVTYVVERPGQVELVEYRPFAAAPRRAASAERSIL